MAEYAVANMVAEEPAFAWWVLCKALFKWNQIKKKVHKVRDWAKTHKYWIELQKTVTDKALRINEQEMTNVMPAFKFIDGDEVSKLNKEIDCHMKLDVKMDLTRKVRWLPEGIKLIHQKSQHIWVL